MKNTIIIFVIIIILALGGYFFFFNGESAVSPAGTLEEGSSGVDSMGINESAPVPDSTQKDLYKGGTQTIIGKSVEGRDITAYHYGDGVKKILFVGGIHGGYSWNTPLVAFEAMDYLKGNSSVVPKNVQVTVIPVLNPDGLEKVTGKAGAFTKADVSASSAVQVSGRFNANTVDINRNFDCDWKAEGMWQSKTVSGGSKAFSEPESQAIKTYIENYKPDAVVVWYSAAGGVFASSCHDGVLPETNTITNIFAKASGYQAYQEFNFYEITGDMVNWLAKNNIPAISVLLSTHEDTEWSKNLAGIKALIAHYAQ